ncbi:MAG: RNA polymerase sigma-70 factor [Bacteroidales bacterium]|nr:RNA polymerase sigma-70 factor [Bacteroidales bacterium]
MSLREKELISGLQLGNKATFDFLFRSYYSGLCSYANIYLKSPDISEEIVQEVFVRLWERHGKILIHTSIRAYLYQSVFNGCINYLKSVQTSGFKHVDLEDVSIRNELLSMDLSDNEFSNIFSEEVEKDLESAINDLPDQCRKIFILSRMDNLTYGEISELLKVSRSTVKTQMSRAMSRILKQMKKYF